SRRRNGLRRRRSLLPPAGAVPARGPPEMSTNSPTNAVDVLPDADLQLTFVAHLPRIRKHTRYALRNVACHDTRDDLACEAVALAWRHFAALARRGKRPEEFVTTLALRCTQAVRAGRRL